MDRHSPALTSHSQTAPRESTSRSAYLSALRQIDRIPVPDLASTLSTAANDDLEATENALMSADASISYLRTQIEAPNSFASDSTADADLSDDPEAYLPADDIRVTRSLSQHIQNTASYQNHSEILESHRQRITRLTDTWRNTMEERDARLDRLERVLVQISRANRSEALLDSSHPSPDTTQRSSWSSAVDSQRERRQRQAELDRVRRESHEREAELQRIQRETSEMMRMFADRSEGIPDSQRGVGNPSHSSQTQDQHAQTQQAQLRAVAQAQAQVLQEHQRALYMQQQQARMQSIQEHSLRTNILRAGASASQYADRMARQDGRRHPRYWARHRESLARNGESADAADASAEGTTSEIYNDAPQSRTQHSRPQSRSTSVFRSRYRTSGQDSGEVSSASVVLQNTMVYLSNLRRSASREDAVSFAIQAAFYNKDFANSNFISDLDQLPSPVPTSLMAPGAMFKGAQFSSAAVSGSSPPNPNASLSSMYQLPHPLTSNSSSDLGFQALTADSESETRRSSLDPGPQIPNPSDSWPVKVSIYDVDFERLTLSASMEAYDVPSNPNIASPVMSARSSGTIHKPITTYLEGEILDFKKNTFITESYPSTISRDLTYWKKLPPFNEFTTTELAGRLLERDFLTRVNTEYILMRWKERCFVSHSPGGPLPRRSANGGAVWRAGADESLEGCNLTISGFYYVSLKRSDGSIEGLYCDPQSSPYQFLKLNRVKTSAFPSWTFK